MQINYTHRWAFVCFFSYVYSLPSLWRNTEFKLQRLLRKTLLFKIEFCVRFNILRLFYVGLVVRNSRSALPLAWHEWFSCNGKQWPQFMTSTMKISSRCLADYVKNFHQKASRTCSTITLAYSTNEIIDLWRYRSPNKEFKQRHRPFHWIAIKRFDARESKTNSFL